MALLTGAKLIPGIPCEDDVVRPDVGPQASIPHDLDQAFCFIQATNANARCHTCTKRAENQESVMSADSQTFYSLWSCSIRFALSTVCVRQKSYWTLKICKVTRRHVASKIDGVISLEKQTKPLDAWNLANIK